ncbi:toxin-antitoxin system YwqK family antitoxin [Tunicatimonas pelagia]|uniref:toxin-antitoxin system YwqK family antitoxin n=1 Tax=Tunicatimonas pelagia TaxID=931531 RepID=UPI0026659587|nr:hypothetical protein [Tunicatimonas pelagia]WKN45353.1 hypothetical protein P0M28_10315 [Tunicatimonas pelagia]
MKSQLIASGLKLLLATACTTSLYTDISSDSQRITIVKQDTIYTFSTLTANQSVSPQSDKFYTWYLRNNIAYSQGGYEGRLLHGSYTKMLRDNTLLEKGAYREGLKDGTWTRWHTNGKIKTVRQWKQGDARGSQETFTSQGTLQETQHFRSGQLHGKETRYMLSPDSSVPVRQTRTWKNNQLTGPFVIYDTLEQIYQQGSYRQGKLHGKVVTHNRYVESEQQEKVITQLTTYQDGKLHGKFKERFPDGHIRRTGKYRYGKLHGKIISYELTPSSEGGNQAHYSKRVYRWKNQQRHGAFREYNSDGTLSKRGSYRDGKLHGKLIRWDEEDNKIIQYYQDGELIKTPLKRSDSKSTSEVEQ